MKLPPYDPQIIEVDEGANAAIAIIMAKGGDLKPLLHVLRSKDCPACSLAADLLEGKVKLPKHRAPNLSNPLPKVWPAMRVVQLETGNWKRDAAVKHVADELKCSERSVRTSLRFCGLTRKRK